MKQIFNKVKYFLQLVDMIWSVPLAYISFILYGVLGNRFFGDGFGFYDPSFFQAAIYAVLTLVLFNGVAFAGLWFNFRTVFKYYLTQSKQDFQLLLPTQRLILFLSLYFFFIILLYLIWVKIV